MRSWITAFRLRTLPLALAVTGMGNLIAFHHIGFQWNIVGLSIITTLLLQILSNVANDYGDSIHGADLVDRKGPSRAVQSGSISKESMFRAIIIFGFLSFLSGLLLLWVSFKNDLFASIPLFVVGLLSIAAAYFYTNGSKPYGYQALGDISVFIFFGLVGVLGTHYLHTKTFNPIVLFPAIAMGLWSTAVLNINNMRDMNSDQAAGKETIPIKLGLNKAKYYHLFLVAGGEVCLLTFALIKSEWVWFGFIPGSLLITKSLSNIWETTINEHLDPYLKPQALGTLLAVVGMAVCNWFVTMMN